MKTLSSSSWWIFLLLVHCGRGLVLEQSEFGWGAVLPQQFHDEVEQAPRDHVYLADLLSATPFPDDQHAELGPKEEFTFGPDMPTTPLTVSAGLTAVTDESLDMMPLQDALDELASASDPNVAKDDDLGLLSLLPAPDLDAEAASADVAVGSAHRKDEEIPQKSGPSASVSVASVASALNDGLGLLALKGSTSGGAIEKQDKQIKGLESALLGMSKAGLDNVTKGFVDEIRRLVQDSMMPQLVYQSNETEQNLILLHDDFHRCKYWEYDTIDWNRLYWEHRGCRRNESRAVAALQNVTEYWQDAYSAMQQICGEFDAIDVIPDHDECGMPTTGMRAWVVHIRTQFKDRYDTWKEAKDKCDAAKLVEATWRQQKTQLEQELDAIREECNTRQDDMDHFACGANIVAASNCAAYVGCYDRAFCAFEEANSSAASLEAALKSQYRALKRIECILLAFEHDDLDAGLDACKAATQSSEPVHIDWEAVEPPPMRNCSEHAAEMPWPNSTEYVRQVYEALPPKSTYKACEAVPCCQSNESSMESFAS